MSSNLIELRRNGGFALLIVLWVLVAVSFIAMHVAAGGRVELRIAGNMYANAAAAAASEGAVNEAIFHLSDTQAAQSWQLDGGVHELLIGHSRVVVRIENEASRINPNSASPTLIEGLLRATGSDDATARRLGTSIAEWVGVAFAGRSPAMIAAEYRAAGLDYTAPRQPIASLEELGRVLGMSPAVLAAIRPHLTLYGPPVPELRGADVTVAAALEFTRTRSGAVRVNLPIEQRGGVKTARIAVAAYGPSDAEVTRTAVVRLDPSLPQGWAMLSWGGSADSSLAPRPGW